MKGSLFKNSKLIILIVLLVGILYKLLITSNGNFIFNIDNARDMVDVREMVVLHKMRLTGPTSGIEGFYNGPAWYYLLAIPFVLTQGNPYSEVLLMILLWAIGGWYLLRISERWGKFITVFVGALWISSNYVTLATVYAFNPNPVILLTPMLIYFMERYLLKGRLRDSITVWLLSGLFFNFEMAFGLFMPMIIFAATVISRKARLFSTKNYWVGFGAFVLLLMPQLLFNVRHGSILLNSVTHHLSSNPSNGSYNVLERWGVISSLYGSVLNATLLNVDLVKLVFILFSILIGGFMLVKKNWRIDPLAASTLMFMLVPFLGSVVLPLNFMPWHLGGVMAAAILFFGLLLHQVAIQNKVFKYICYLAGGALIAYCFYNLDLPNNFNLSKTSTDPSSYSNEIRAIDTAYNIAEGKDFRAYVYIPSVIDYPYQYLFWWYGKIKYGYIPKDYAYLPNKPQYISNVQAFAGDGRRVDSGLTILILDPTRQDLRDLWLNSFKNQKLIETKQAGPYEVQVRI